MFETPSTQIVCIVPRLGARVGGGKIHAVFRRMNLLAERANSQVVLLNLQHGVKQKVAFGNLQAQGVLDARIVHRSIHEFCTPAGHIGPRSEHMRLPAWDQQIAKGGTKTRILYLDGATPVMRDTIEKTSAGTVIVRQILSDPHKDTRLKYLNDELVESLSRLDDGHVYKVFYSRNQVICEAHIEHNSLRSLTSPHLDQTFQSEITFHKALAAKTFPPNCVVFIDGITNAYLSRHIAARQVLFLHADHRAPDGTIVPRSRFLIESFDGDAIVTATHVHKSRLEADTKHTVPIRVIAHYTDPPKHTSAPRAHLCTVSRLDLDGKPIHQCIEAFTRIMHEIPGCNYLIYGSGIGHARLAQLIDHHGCADRVKLMGHTSNPAEVFASSLFALAPTMTEGFGLSLLEALTNDCPVISYDVDYGPRELIQPGKNGELVKPGHIDGIAHAILRLHAQRDAYAAACQNSVKPYAFDVYRQKYLQLIEDLVGKQHVFDISAQDLKSETLQAIDAAALTHKARLFDLYIKLCLDSHDIAGAYWGFQQKRALFPQVQRPLMRCIWLSRRLGRNEECKQHLAAFSRRFPDQHAEFVARYPDFLSMAEADL